MFSEVESSLPTFYRKGHTQPLFIPLHQNVKVLGLAGQSHFILKPEVPLCCVTTFIFILAHYVMKYLRLIAARTNIKGGDFAVLKSFTLTLLKHANFKEMKMVVSN